MDVQEALARVRSLSDKQAITEMLAEHLTQFLPVEDQSPESVIWLEGGGKVSTEALRAYQAQLEAQAERLSEELTHLLACPVEQVGEQDEG